jgi:hypothetical protein
VRVLKVLDRACAREALAGMDETARAYLWNALQLNEEYGPGDNEKVETVSACRPLVGPNVGTDALRAVPCSSQFHRDERAFTPAGPNLGWIGRGPCVESRFED